MLIKVVKQKEEAVLAQVHIRTSISYAKHALSLVEHHSKVEGLNVTHAASRIVCSEVGYTTCNALNA